MWQGPWALATVGGQDTLLTARPGAGAGGEPWAPGPLQGRVPETVPGVGGALCPMSQTSLTRSQGSSEGRGCLGDPAGVAPLMCRLVFTMGLGTSYSRSVLSLILDGFPAHLPVWPMGSRKPPTSQTPAPPSTPDTPDHQARVHALLRPPQLHQSPGPCSPL